MLPRIRRTGLVLAMVVLAYAVYSLAVVPWIEPSIQFARGTAATPLASPRGNRYERYFPAGSWELGRPKVVETDRGTLLFANYQPLPDGKVKLTRCTVIADVQAPSRGSAGNGPDPRETRPIIIRAPQGATLMFDQTDQKWNVLQANFGRLVGGLLEGEITIHSPPTQPGGHDGLDIVTRNVQIDTHRIWTPHEVRFKYGANSGSGRVLTIHLAGKKSSARSSAGLDMHGVRELELLHLDQMELALNGQGLFGQSQPDPARPRPEDAANVDVRCQGPLRFHVLQQLITLEDQVQLTRQHPGGARDQLCCQFLEIHFESRNRAAAAAPAGEAGQRDARSAALRPARVVATGTPVTVRAAAMGMGARAERIEYDCILQRVWLNDRDKVLLNDQDRQVEAKEIRYAIGEGNRLGELFALGPGILRGTWGEDARRFEVSWRKEVHLQRIRSEPVLWFDARVTVVVAGLGRVSGDRLQLYLREVPRPAAPGRFDPVPDRVHLVGNVQVETLTYRGALGEAKIWFQNPSSAAAATPTSAEPPAIGAGEGGGPAGSGPASTYELTADAVEAVVFLGDRPVTNLVIARGSVQVLETTAGISQPLSVRGDHFELQDGASLHPRAALLGQPAEFVARGGSARGPKIYLHPLDNYLEIVGAGDLELPAGTTRPAEAPNAAHDAGHDPAPTKIEWQGKMQFDGQIIRCQQDVAIRGTSWSEQEGPSTFLATGDAVHAVLDKPIDFQHAQRAGRVELAEAAFDGWGFLQMETRDRGGDRKLFGQMQVLALSVNQRSGDIRGQGPGWVRGIQRGNEWAETGLTGAGASPRPSTNLSFLRVDFQREITGNLNGQRLEFLNGTNTIYGPVASWDDALDTDDGPLRPGVVRLTSDRLAVSRPTNGPGDAVELEAVGNAHVLGESFSATGGRVSYARLKDQLILEGDGRNDARIEFRPQPGARPSHLAAGKILYWPKTRQCQIIDWRQTELYDLGQLRTREAPAVRPR